MKALRSRYATDRFSNSLVSAPFDQGRLAKTKERVDATLASGGWGRYFRTIALDGPSILYEYSCYYIHPSALPQVSQNPPSNPPKPKHP